MASFNLCDEPWIPIAGESARRSLTGVFGDLKCPELSGNAVDKIVILRFLLCIVHASTPVPDDDAWLALTPEKLSENALAYLEKWHDRFDLYGDKPFLQFPVLEQKLSLEEGKKKDKEEKRRRPLSVFVDSIGSDNNAALTNWHKFYPLSEAEKTIMLLRLSCYACSGRNCDKELVLSQNYQKKVTPGTLLGKEGYLHSYLLGETLLETLHFNMLSEENISETGAFSSGMGTPFWEDMPVDECGKRASDYSNSYMGILFPMDKFLLFTGDRIIMTVGIKYPDHEDGLADPALTCTENKNKKGKEEIILVKVEKKPWRELSSVLSFLEHEQKRHFSFLSKGWEKIRQSGCQLIRIWTGGAKVSSDSGGQKMSGKDDYLESVFIFRTDKDPQWRRNYWKLMEYLDEKSEELCKAVKGYCKELGIATKQKNDPSSKIASRVCQKFWNRLEREAQEIVDLAYKSSDSDEVNMRYKHWFGLLCSIYDESCPHDTPRQITAWVDSAPGNNEEERKK